MWLCCKSKSYWERLRESSLSLQRDCCPNCEPELQDKLVAAHMFPDHDPLKVQLTADFSPRHRRALCKCAVERKPTAGGEGGGGGGFGEVA